MGVHTIRKGLDLPIAGRPAAAVEQGRAVQRVAVLGADYHGMKPRLVVQEGDRVLRGQQLFEDRKTPGVYYTAPGTGVVEAIHRGARRAFVSLVIRLDQGEAELEQVALPGAASADGPPTAEQVEALLLASGLWTALRTRPYSRVPAPGTRPGALFVTAVDTHPLAPDVGALLAARKDDLQAGLGALQRLCGKVYLCVGAGSQLDAGGLPGVQVERFAGKHPAGLAGTHIHLLEPASRQRVQWSIGGQDVAALGHLLRTGRLDVERVVTVGGPAARQPRHLRTRLGASLDELLQGELVAPPAGAVRVVSGSVLGGRAASGPEVGYLGRLHQQVTLLGEGGKRQFLGWLTPGLGAFSSARIYLSSLTGARELPLDTDTNGSPRAMVPIGMYERVMPLDIMPTFLLRALAVGDLEQAEALGALELDEEDLALCTFVCPGKIDHGANLRERLTQIEKEG